MNPDLDHLESIIADMVNALRPLKFKPPVSHVYNPLEYAREPFRQYLTKFASTPKEVVLLGMNPRPVFLLVSSMLSETGCRLTLRSAAHP